MATVLRGSDILFSDGSTISSGKGAAKAWVNFNGWTSAVRASLNVSSVTRNGTGDYTVNFTSPLADTSYVVSGSAGNDQVLGYDSGRLFSEYGSGARTTSSCRVCTAFVYQATDTTYPVDSDVVSVCVFR